MLMMMLKPTKITIFLLITVLLTASLGSAFGFVSCEYGCESKIHLDNHPSDKHNDDFAEDSAISDCRLVSDNDDSCRDYFVQLSDSLFENNERFKCLISPTIGSTSDTLPNPVLCSLCVRNPYLKSSTIISQTILAHRTVVILR